MLEYNRKSQTAENQHGISDFHNFIAVEKMLVLNKTMFILNDSQTASNFSYT